MSRATSSWTHVSQPLTHDGAAVNIVIREVSNVGAAAGIHTTVAAWDRSDVHFPRAEILGVDFSRYVDHEQLSTPERIADLLRGRAGLSRRNVERLYRAIAEALPASSGPIIVHDGYLGAAGLVTLSRACPDRQLFLWMHNRLSPAYARREVRRFISLADKVICVSDWIHDSLADALRSPPIAARLETVLNGVDVSRFTPPEQNAGEGRVPSILFSGRMLKLKGPDLLAAALGDLHARGVDFRATFLGISSSDPREASAFERSLRRATESFADKVSFLPFRPNSELPDIYRAHDVLVVPSRFEDPCPLVLLEGMASGMAIVAARRGGIPQVGEDAIRYFTAPGELSSVLRSVIEDPGLRTDLGRRARGRAEHLTWGRTLEGVRRIIVDAQPA